MCAVPFFRAQYDEHTVCDFFVKWVRIWWCFVRFQSFAELLFQHPKKVSFVSCVDRCFFKSCVGRKELPIEVCRYHKSQAIACPAPAPSWQQRLDNNSVGSSEGSIWFADCTASVACGLIVIIANVEIRAEWVRLHVWYFLYWVVFFRKEAKFNFSIFLHLVKDSMMRFYLGMTCWTWRFEICAWITCDSPKFVLVLFMFFCEVFELLA
jgi:hypothetical protein